MLNGPSSYRSPGMGTASNLNLFKLNGIQLVPCASRRWILCRWRAHIGLYVVVGRRQWAVQR